jgi:hypothetical protein
MSSIEIFRTELGDGKESWMQVNHGGSVTYHSATEERRLFNRGAPERVATFSAEEAKSHWPAHAGDINRALKQLGRQ